MKKCTFPGILIQLVLAHQSMLANAENLSSVYYSHEHLKMYFLLHLYHHILVGIDTHKVGIVAMRI